MNKLKSAIGVLVVLAMVFGLVRCSEKLLEPGNTRECVAAVEAFHQLPENSIDVMIYGSSHAWRGVDSVEMYDKHGIGAYNYGANWQRLSTEALFFYDSLRTQSPKVAMIETFRLHDLVKDQNMDGEVYYTRKISDFPFKRQYLRTAFGDRLDRYVAYYFPISQLHSNWTSISHGSFINPYTPEDFIGTMGYFHMPSADMVTPVELYDPMEATQLELREDVIEILDGIVATCKEQGIELVFFNIPWRGGNQQRDAITRYAEENGCVYLDLFLHVDEMGFDPETDFMDIEHLNHSGALKVADYLGAYLREHYDLRDMREVPGNLWEGKTGNVVGLNQ